MLARPAHRAGVEALKFGENSLLLGNDLCANYLRPGLRSFQPWARKMGLDDRVIAMLSEEKQKAARVRPRLGPDDQETIVDTCARAASAA